MQSKRGLKRSRYSVRREHEVVHHIRIFWQSILQYKEKLQQRRMAMSTTLFENSSIHPPHSLKEPHPEVSFREELPSPMQSIEMLASVASWHTHSRLSSKQIVPSAPPRPRVKKRTEQQVRLSQQCASSCV